ncbi:hypothetical protein NCS56_00000700 [Fusarium sp. Ph1]|nr:hypothetical protein NCS56_00000700 [Fusarium sp. Ph1]
MQWLASIDLANTFNSVDRASIAASVATYAPTFYKAAAWAYNDPSVLVTEDGSAIASAKGVRQGDPLGPLLFSLAFRPTLEALAEKLPGATLVAYLDDLYILNKAPHGTLEAAKEIIKGSPFSLNLTKSKEKAIEDLKLEGLKALGTHIGPIRPRRAFLQDKLASLQEALEALQDLPKQHSLLLLRSSIQLLLRHLQRQLDPTGLEDLWEEADTLIREAILALVARTPSECPKEPNPSLIALPVREGGLGIPLHKDLAHDLFLAAKEASQPTIDLIRKLLAPSSPSGSPGPRLGRTAQQVLKEANKTRLAGFLENLPSSYKHARLENASYLGRKWLGVLSTQKALSFTDSEITEAL